MSLESDETRSNRPVVSSQAPAESASSVQRARIQGLSRDAAPAAPPVPETPPTPRRDRRWLYIALGFLAGLTVAGTFWLARPSTPQSLSQNDVDAAIEQALLVRDGSTGTAAQAYNQIAPSLVVVRALPVGAEPTQADAMTRNGIGLAPGTSIGGGVVINRQGQILTSNHVVADAGSIEIVFADGTQSLATIVSSEPSNDIAVLEAVGAAGAIVPAVLGNSRTTEIGDQIFAVGNPLGLTSSITAGVVSGLDRNIPFRDDLVLNDLIQFDAAVNQGSSGGPLLDQRGHVIGIVTALADPASTGFFIGIGFAVPIDIAAQMSAEGPSQ